ncbi:MAG: DUF4942 domain-containing protein [Oligoflexia bacterium]|nr:DUF4942 domain-containing protein [Oligoflexia bacterium]
MSIDTIKDTLNDSKDFYPTPEVLFTKMVAKINDKAQIRSVLDPSAGKGDLLKHHFNWMKDHYSRGAKYYAIEIENSLQSVLRDLRSDDFRKINIDVIDSDFLKYQGSQQFDLILANFPFSDGEYHLNKAIDMMYSGQIVCLLNAQTIKNPFSNERKRLVQRLDELGASVEFVENAFSNAQRKSDVEVALIYIDKRKSIEDDLFEGMEGEEKESSREFKEGKITSRRGILDLVKEYSAIKENGTRSIYEYYKNFSELSEYMSLSVRGAESTDGSLTDEVKAQINGFNLSLKHDYWSKLIELKEVRKKLTKKGREKFHTYLTSYLKYEFSEDNIRRFLMNLTEAYPDAIGDCVEEIFHEFTKHAFYERATEQEKKNVYLYNGWKSNSAFKINKKIIYPFWALSGALAEKSISWDVANTFEDIYNVLTYFKKEGSEDAQTMLSNLKEAVKAGETKYVNDIVDIRLYKKGTCHIKFIDEDVLRLLNIEGSKRKGFLPFDYGHKETESMSEEELELVENFEGLENYKVIPADKRIGAFSEEVKLLVA